jgi:thiol-disulfide isomerase/thioredoxin
MAWKAKAGESGGDGKPPRRLLVTAILALLLGLAVYGIGGASDNGWGGAARASTRLNSGHMAAFVYKDRGEVLAQDFKFLDGAGKERRLKDWAGKVVLLNLWATWCTPCRKEMPDLDKLQAELGSADFEVVAVSVDRAGLEASRKFLDSIKVAKLALYADPSARLAIEMKAIGLPATILIGRDGREIGRLLGPAEWASEDAKRLVRGAMQ